ENLRTVAAFEHRDGIFERPGGRRSEAAVGDEALPARARRMGLLARFHCREQDGRCMIDRYIDDPEIGLWIASGNDKFCFVFHSLITLIFLGFPSSSCI